MTRCLTAFAREFGMTRLLAEILIIPAALAVVFIRGGML